MPYSENELSALVAQVRRPFKDRDDLWDSRRDVRHRRTPSSAPKDLSIINPEAHLDYRSPLPGFVISRLVNRLGTNEIEVALKIRSQKPSILQKGERLEDWFRGAQHTLDPIGAHDRGVRQHQVADGVGFFEVEMLPGYIAPKRGPGLSDGDYDELRDDGARNYGLPVALNAPDPRSLYWVKSRGQVKLMTKVINIPLIDARMNWSQEGFRLAYDGDGAIDSETKRMKGTVKQVPILGQGIAPAPTAAEYGVMVRFVLIADEHYIYHCISPVPGMQGTTGLGAWDYSLSTDGGVFPLTLLKAYPNHGGCVPFFEAVARSNDDPNPAFADQPLAMEVLDLAPYINTWKETGMVRGRMQALAPIHFKPDSPKPGDNTTPKAVSLEWKPGVWEAPGQFAAIQLPQMPDFDKQSDSLAEELSSYNLSMMGAAQQGIIGRTTPAWGIMQLNEEQVGFLQEAQDGRAVAWKGVLEYVAKCVKERYAKNGPIYVMSDVLDRKNPHKGAHADMVSATAEDFEIPFEVKVTIHGETQSQAAARTEYYRELKAEGTISDETYENTIGISDRVAEQARKDNEAIQKPMRMAGQKVGAILGFMELRAVYGPLIDVIAQPILDAMGLTPQDMAAAQGQQMGATPLMDSLVMPGQGMSNTMNKYGGARQIAQPEEAATGTNG